jgi:hypothetical protein
LLRKYISYFLLLTISLFIVPKEYIHDIYNHQDTRCFEHQQSSFEKAHIHCEILKYNTPHYCFSYQIFLLPFAFLQGTFSAFQLHSRFIQMLHHFDLRAPPIVAVFTSF